ncbi:MAG: copper chaperone PCu(A)C [Halofilum sp. (in: g-proteobacteria)]|nr:copper chaperone PCu(A)C [Halofilum sp. (in: g-proteobacteria)]
MKPTSIFTTLLLALLLAAPAGAHDYRLGDLYIDAPWSRATAPGASVGAGYLDIRNEGEREDRLTGATSPVAGRVMIHRSVERDGTTTMEHQHRGVAIPAGGEVAFAPGGYHLMLMQLEERLEKGDRVPVTLEFERAGKIEVELDVKGMTEELE